jgi:DNA damage-binding protein 1
MKVVSTFHAPSSVVSSLRLQTPDSLCLVLARPDVIEVYKVTPDGLQLLQKQDVWGRILSVKPIPNQSSAFLVLTDHPDPRLIFMTLNGTEVISTGVVSLFEQNARVAEFFTDVIVNPYGTLAVVSSYTSKLRFVRIEGGRPQTNFDVSYVNNLSL